MRRVWAALVLGLGLALTGCGTVPHGTAPPRRATTTFDGHAVWFSGQRSYRHGLHPLHAAASPWTYEAVELQPYGPATVVYAARSGRPHEVGSWSSPLKLGRLRSFTVDGERYAVPKAYAGMDIAVLPIAHGLVWLALPARGPAAFTGGVLGEPRLNPSGLQGATPIYYTPYLPRGGSLLQGRETIASLPHRWFGLDAPVAASAWTGWLPAADLQAPGTVSAAAHALTYDKSQHLTGDRTVRTNLPGYPSLFLRQVGRLQAGQHPLIAWVERMTRTAGGFVLEVQFWDTNFGIDASGLLWADYYWSETSGRWTPLTQIFGQQDLMSFVDVGSRAVYWQQALGVPPGNGSHLDLVQMRFDPESASIAPVWAGGYIYGQTFTDGRSWIHDMLQTKDGGPNLPAVSVWTANTP